MLSICFVCFILLYKSRLKGMPIIVACCIATASIHELTLAVFDIALSTELPQGVSIQYAIYLSLFLVIAVWKGSHFQRRILGIQFLALFCLYLLDIILKPGSTIVGSQPSPLFYNPLTNVVEVFSWLIPALLWLLPQKKVEQAALLSQR
jgi:putative Ca2+/H+ antiporter (TMEM165/GDT1 family)